MLLHTPLEALEKINPSQLSEPKCDFVADLLARHRFGSAHPRGQIFGLGIFL